MPRKSAASLGFPTVTGSPERLRPPPGLSEPERAIFLDLVAGTKPDAFRSSDTPLLAAYCRAIALEIRSAQELSNGDDKALTRWAQAIKSMVALSMRLRLSPQARAPNNPSRPGRPEPVMSYYDRMRLEQEGDS
jgi:hypothetical protein